MYCTVCPIFRLETFLEGYNTGLAMQYKVSYTIQVMQYSVDQGMLSLFKSNASGK